MEELTNTLKQLINNNKERKFKYEKFKESKDLLNKRIKIIQVL